GQGGDDVGAASDAGVHEDFHAVAHAVGDRRQGVEGCRHVVELAAAVVRHDHRVDAEVGCLAGVGGGEDPFEGERAVPCLADPVDVVPAQGAVEHVGQGGVVADV